MKKKGILKSAALTLSGALALSSVSAAPLLESFASASDYYLIGDVVDNDGVTAADALALQKSLVGTAELDQSAAVSADANFDGTVGIADATAIMQWLVGGDKSYHVGEYIKKSVAAAESVLTNQKLSGEGDSVSFTYDAEFEGYYKIRVNYASLDSYSELRFIANDGNVYTPISVTEEMGEAVAVIALPAGANNIAIVLHGYVTANVSMDIADVNICRTITAPDKTVERTEYPVTTTSAPAVITTTSPAATTSTTTATATTSTAATTTTTAATTTEAPATTTTAEPDPVVSRYYAIEGNNYDGWNETNNTGYAGEAYWNYNNAIGGYVEWTVNVAEAGNYRVDFRYANGTTTDRPVKVMVNGEHNQCIYLDFEGTGAWTTWSDSSIVLTLNAGENKIKARATTTGGGPNMDYIELTKTNDAATAMVKATDGKTMENLSRGVSMAHTNSGNLVSWRLFANDNENTTFNLWRITKDDERTMLGTFTMNDASCYLDTAGAATDVYTIDTYVNGECVDFASFSTNYTTTNSGQSGAYFDIPTQTPPDQTMPDGSTCSYTENDCSVGDVDGDGQYEIIVKWDPSNSQDNSKTGYTGTVFLDCYKLDGTLMWRIDLGKNIRAGAHYTQFMVYDFDSDGKAELICKTADGTVDGKGNVIGSSTADYRSSAGTVLSGPEYITLFDGETGAALDTQNYTPSRGEQNKDTWGDAYGNRSERYTACVAYLDGTNASAVFGRGYYTRLAVSAWDVQNKKLVQRWLFDTGFNSSVAGYGDGNHQELAADVDNDGKDEVVCGSAVIDDNGSLLYTTSLAHGDAMHIGDFDPTNPGLEIFQCLEDSTHPNGTEVGYGIILRDAATGKVLYRETAEGDTGRCLADNLVAGNNGAEMVGSHSGNVRLASGDHDVVCQWSDITKWGQNSVVYWTDVLERAVLDRTMVDQYGKGRVFTGDGVTFNNASKSNLCLTCDLTGDWREELIARKSDGGLRVFTTTYSTSYNNYCLMHNSQYRVQVAAQNNGYNQPPHTDYFLGTGFDLPIPDEIHTPD